MLVRVAADPTHGLAAEPGESQMPIDVSCSCGKSFSVPDHFAGKSGKCKACGARLVIPEPADNRPAAAFGFLDGEDLGGPVVPAALPWKQVPTSTDFPTVVVDTPDEPDEPVRCPKCRSSQLSADKKGFGAGKALIGGVLTGGVGLLAGFIGSKKIMITCRKCGHQWKAGQS